MNNQPTIFIVDDNAPVRESVAMLVQKNLGLPVEKFATAGEFLDSRAYARHGCLVLDVRLPGQSGLELIERLTELGSSLAVIVVSGHGDAQTRAQILGHGAVKAFLEKPFRPHALLDQVRSTLKLA